MKVKQIARCVGVGLKVLQNTKLVPFVPVPSVKAARCAAGNLEPSLSPHPFNTINPSRC